MDWEFSTSWLSHLPYVHGGQLMCAFPSTLVYSVSWNDLSSLLVLTISWHSQLISKLISSRKSAKRRSFNEFPLVFILLSSEMCKHLW